MKVVRKSDDHSELVELSPHAMKVVRMSEAPANLHNLVPAPPVVDGKAHSGQVMRFLVGIVLCSACLPAPQPAPAYGQAGYGQPGYGNQQQTAGYAGETCLQLFQCLATCTQDAACHQGCLDRGNDESRAATTALIQCNSTGAACESELSTCRNQSQVVAQSERPAPQQQPQDHPPATEQMMPGQPHTTANILPWMTGYWQGLYYHYDFYADGRVKRSSGTPLYTEKTGRYACASLVNETGTVRQEGDLLIMEFSAANASHCGDNESAPGRTLRLRITWYQYNGPVELKLVDIDCQSGACSDPMTRKR